MRTTRRRILMMVAVIPLAACGSSTSETAASTSAAETTTVAPAAPDSPTPFHAVPTEPVLITGSATCSFSFEPFSATCQLDLSDPRVTGTETHDSIIFHPGGEVGDVWFAADAMITNDEGSWTGSAQAADDGVPIGEAHYVGDGAYEGLEFHYYFFQADLGSPAKVLGWISDGA